MLKRFSIAIVGVLILLSFIACSQDNTCKPDKAINQTQSALTTDVPQSNSTTEEKQSVFKTEDIIRITFYAYYGNGKGSEVPAEHSEEIIDWLDSFEIDTDRECPQMVPDGTNTIHVEIEYSDGSIVKQGMDTTVVDGVTYYIIGDDSPECYDEIISKTALN
jgi:hypothetical protein